jgi:hypothetical protein
VLRTNWRLIAVLALCAAAYFLGATRDLNDIDRPFPAWPRLVVFLATVCAASLVAIAGSYTHGFVYDRFLSSVRSSVDPSPLALGRFAVLFFRVIGWVFVSAGLGDTSQYFAGHGESHLNAALLLISAGLGVVFGSHLSDTMFVRGKHAA